MAWLPLYDFDPRPSGCQSGLQMDMMQVGPNIRGDVVEWSIQYFGSVVLTVNSPTVVEDQVLQSTAAKPAKLYSSLPFP